VGRTIFSHTTKKKKKKTRTEEEEKRAWGKRKKKGGRASSIATGKKKGGGKKGRGSNIRTVPKYFIGRENAKKKKGGRGKREKGDVEGPSPFQNG